MVLYEAYDENALDCAQDIIRDVDGGAVGSSIDTMIGNLPTIDEKGQPPSARAV